MNEIQKGYGRSCPIIEKASFKELPNLYTLLDEVNFEKRIVDFNERQRAFSVIRDIYEIIQDRELVNTKKTSGNKSS